MSGDSKRFVVFDIDIPNFQKNRMFDRNFISQFPGGEPFAYLAEQARNRGMTLETVDVFLERRRRPAKALCFSNMITRYTRHLLRGLGLYPAACISLESSVIAYDFYHNIQRYSEWFRHVFLFGGMRGRVKGQQTTFHNLYWPLAKPKVVAGPVWRDRAYLTLINSNKRSFQYHVLSWDVRHPRRLLNGIYHWLRTEWIHHTDLWFRSDLYLERLEAIRYFSGRSGFDLYGRGWQESVAGVSDEYNNAVRRSYRGELPPLDKLTTLAKYKFAICFENCIFPGYVTEKIFDCFFAGSIPIYYGAPDITNFVPAETFVDFRQFKDYETLDGYLREMTVDKAGRYLKAAQDFLVSDQFDKFTQEFFADELLGCFEECFAEIGV